MFVMKYNFRKPLQQYESLLQDIKVEIDSNFCYNRFYCDRFIRILSPQKCVKQFIIIRLVMYNSHNSDIGQCIKGEYVMFNSGLEGAQGIFFQQLGDNDLRR